MQKTQVNVKDMYDKTVPISELSRGKLGSTMKKVHDSGDSMVVFKDNRPYTLIVSLEEYENLQKIKENYELLLLAIERTSKASSDDYVTEEEVFKKYGIDNAEIEELAETVEIE